MYLKAIMADMTTNAIVMTCRDRTEIFMTSPFSTLTLVPTSKMSMIFQHARLTNIVLDAGIACEEEATLSILKTETKGFPKAVLISLEHFPKTYFFQ
jgi:hypothetical protein